jgi:RHS repeat-associated protein
MAGISNKALNGVAKNRFKYNGKEEQRTEFSDESGLEWLDYGARMYDAQIGRWHVVDPMSSYFSHETPYNYGGNNPSNLIDVGGKYKMKPGDQKKYSVLANYLRSGIKEILNSPRIMNALKKYGQFSEKDVKEKIIKWNSGIEIQIVDKPGGLEGANGFYMGGRNNPIQISKSLADQLQNSSNEDRQAALLAIVSTIFHESVHQNDWSYDGIPAANKDETYYNLDGSISGFSTEVGDAFESEVYHNGDFWSQQKAKRKVGRVGLNNMRKRIEQKRVNEDEKRDLPGMSWEEFGTWLGNALALNPYISVTIK